MEETIIAIVTAVLGGIFTFVHQWLKTRLTPERLSTVNQLARVAVEAAEEIGRATDGVTSGEKFRVAENFLIESAKRVGVKLTPSEANGFIHAMLNGQRGEVERQVNAILDDILSNSEASDLTDLSEVSAGQ